MIKKIQNTISRIAGSKKGESQRNKQVYNYSDADSIAIIFKLRDENQYDIIRKYMSFLKDEHQIKNIMTLCYVEEKEIPAYVKPRVDFETFSKKDINWQQIPAGMIVDNFVNEAYNILIDLSKDDDMPVKHIVNQSKANFKLGRHSDVNENLYDMMISSNDGQDNVKALIEHINHYLTIINS